MGGILPENKNGRILPSRLGTYKPNLRGGVRELRKTGRADEE